MAENQTNNKSAERPTNIQQSPTVGNIGPNILETLGEAMRALLREEKFCDVTFCVGPTKKEIKCHKLVLIARSDVFETMFSERWNSTSLINLPDTEPQVFELFLQFIYGDECTNSAPMAIKLLELAHEYNVIALVQKCEDLLSQDLKMKDCIEIFKLARQYSLESLMEKAGNLMASSFVPLSKDVTFREMDEGTLMYLLEKDDLLAAEIDIFTIVLRWAQDNKGSSGSCAGVLKNIIPLIRFPVMKVEEFASDVVPVEVLPQKDVIDLFLYFNSRASIRENAAGSLKFSSIPRKGQRLIVVELYGVPDTQIQSRWLTFMHGRCNGGLRSVENHEDILEITWNPVYLLGSSHHKMKLASLILKGMNYDMLRSMSPYGPHPHSNNRVTVWVETDNLQHQNSSFPFLSGDSPDISRFSTECVITEGNETEVTVEPWFEFRPNVKYNVVIKFQNALVIPGCNSNPNVDVLSNSKLKSSFENSELRGSLKVNMVQTPNSSQTQTRSFHVVRALKFVLE